MPDSRFFNRKGPFSIKEIANHLKCELIGDGDAMIHDISTISEAKEGELTFVNDSFLSTAKYKEQFKECKASACIINEKLLPIAPKGVALLVCEESHDSYAIVTEMFYSEKREDNNLISPKAHICEGVKIGANTTVEAFAYISNNVEIGENSYISSGVHIGQGVKIGKGARIYSNASILCAIIGDNIIIHSGVRIGQDGFGFAISKFGIKKVMQLGRVLIGHNVEIGSNTCIDRGSIEDTIIGDNCKIDNLVQFGHNVVLGRNCFTVAQVGIAGSTKLGDGVMLGGQVGIVGHINIGAGAKIAAKSGVMFNVEPGEMVGGIPAQSIKQWHRQTAMLKKMVQNSAKKNKVEEE